MQRLKLSLYFPQKPITLEANSGLLGTKPKPLQLGRVVLWSSGSWEWSSLPQLSQKLLRTADEKYRGKKWSPQCEKGAPGIRNPIWRERGWKSATSQLLWWQVPRYHPAVQNPFKVILLNNNKLSTLQLVFTYRKRKTIKLRAQYHFSSSASMLRQRASLPPSCPFTLPVSFSAITSKWLHVYQHYQWTKR